MLNEVKKSLMIPKEETFADDEIKIHIDSCVQLLHSFGVALEVLKSDNALVKALIVIYVKTFYGFKADGTVKELPTSFELLYKQLVMST